MKTIRGNLIVSVSAIALVICLLLGGVNALLLNRTATQGMDTSVTAAANAYSKAIQHQTQIFLTQVMNMANDKRINPTASVDNLKSLADELQKNSDFQMVSFANGKGVPYDMPQVDITKRDYFKSAIAGVPYISSPLISKKSNTVVLYVAAKVNNGTGYDGIVFGELSNDIFSQIIKDVSIGQNGYGFIIDKTGTIIAHKDNALVESFTNYATLSQDDASFSALGSFISEALKNQSGTASINNGGTEQYVAYTPISGTDGWILVMAADKAEMLASYTQGLVISGALTGVFLIVSILFALFISNSIGKPISQIVKRLVLLSKGDLNSPIPAVKSKNEVRQLAGSLENTVSNLRSYIQDIHLVLSNISNGNLNVFTNQEYIGDFADIKLDMNGITESLNTIMRRITIASDQVGASSSLVSNSSMALSQGATEQASAIEQLTASLEDVSAQTSRNAENAGKVDEISKSAKANAAGGNKRMKDMLTAMEDINESSTKISKIIKVIDDIAFQTNILALNAAVEAARAGQHGKGFAVVAEEVRTLAAKSANAARETTDLIETSIKKVEAGTKIANETADALAKILTEVDRVAELVATIATASQEQAGSISQINLGVSQVSQVVQTNAATAEESAAASQELSAQAEQLKQTVGVFKIKEDDTPVLSDETTVQSVSRKRLSAGRTEKKISLGDGDFGKY